MLVHVTLNIHSASDLLADISSLKSKISNISILSLIFIVADRDFVCHF